jgi:hypothetical protein
METALVAAIRAARKRAADGKMTALTSSIAPKDVDSSHDPWSCCRFAVRRPGSPVASPRSHGMPCRGFVLSRAYARLTIANPINVRYGTDI